MCVCKELKYFSFQHLLISTAHKGRPQRSEMQGGHMLGDGNKMWTHDLHVDMKTQIHYW